MTGGTRRTGCEAPRVLRTHQARRSRRPGPDRGGYRRRGSCLAAAPTGPTGVAPIGTAADQALTRRRSRVQASAANLTEAAQRGSSVTRELVSVSAPPAATRPTTTATTA